MILLFASRPTSRIRYAVSFLLQDILGTPFEITDDLEQFNAFTGPRINYSQQNIPNALHIFPADILQERGVSPQEVRVIKWEGTKALFPSPPHAGFPFDPFAAAFYMITRYEEYLPFISDQHQRFEAHASLAMQENFLADPVVDRWAIALGHALQKQFPTFSPAPRKYRYLSTVDIDNAYAYKEKGLIRTAGGYLKSFAAFDLNEVILRTRVLLRQERDPYDTYEQLLDIQKRYDLRPIYFFLVADYGHNDKNLSVHNRRFQALIKRLADYADTGVHPSYGSNQRPEQLLVESQRLSAILNRETERSRQHFLKMAMPETYRRLLLADIHEDHTMGFAEQIGFRAGTCTPFHFYDLEREEWTDLKVVPFQVMDATLKYYMKLKPEEVIGRVKPLIDQVRSVNGLFVSLWHNESLSENEIWKGWNPVYEELVREAQAS
ncbi:MAG: polysaccharide deacetylase family protein [Flavobacteriales bacterium]|nr:polysaccharide deacetylase family protein [Flavobacteriales bacterium]